MFSIEKQKSFDKKLLLDEKDFNYSHQCEKYEWYVSGNLFYIIKKNSIIKKDKIGNKVIDTLFKNCDFEPSKIKNSLEGHYVCIIKKSGQIKIFGDRFNRFWGCQFAFCKNA